MNDMSIKEMNIQANDHSLIEFITIVFQRERIRCMIYRYSTFMYIIL